MATGTVTRRRSCELTERDAAALMWVAEQYGARLDVLSVLLARLAGRAEPLSIWGVRNQVDRWQRMRLVTADRVLGATWVTPTRAGLDRAGAEFPVWRVPAAKLAHTHAVSVVRLAYEATSQAQSRPWVCERATWKERGKMGWHVPDGVLRDPAEDETSRSVAVEVELTLKTRKQYRAEVIGNLRNGTAVLWYFTPSQPFARVLETHVTAAIEAARTDVKAMVRPLPHVPGITYMGKVGALCVKYKDRRPAANCRPGASQTSITAASLRPLWSWRCCACPRPSWPRPRGWRC